MRGVRGIGRDFDSFTTRIREQMISTISLPHGPVGDSRLPRGSAFKVPACLCMPPTASHPQSLYAMVNSPTTTTTAVVLRARPLPSVIEARWRSILEKINEEPAKLPPEWAEAVAAQDRAEESVKQLHIDLAHVLRHVAAGGAVRDDDLTSTMTDCTTLVQQLHVANCIVRAAKKRCMVERTARQLRRLELRQLAKPALEPELQSKASERVAYLKRVLGLSEWSAKEAQERVEHATQVAEAVEAAMNMDTVRVFSQRVFQVVR